MTSQRRKAIKWRKWKSKNPHKADAAFLRKLAKIELFDKKRKRLILRAFDNAGAMPNPLEEFFIKNAIVPVTLASGFRFKLFDTKEDAQEALKEALSDD